VLSVAAYPALFCHLGQDKEATMTSVPSTILTCLALFCLAPLASAQQTDASYARSSAPAGAYMYQLPPETQGDLYVARRQYVSAIEAYRHAPLMNARTWVKIGVAYHHLFAMDEALKAYQMAIRLDSHNSDAFNNIGAVYHGKRQYGTAVKWYKRALKYAPKSAPIYCNLGTTYFASHKYKEAEKAYGHAFALDPKAFDHDSNATIDEGSTREERIAQNYYLARTFARAGNHQQALVYLRKAFDEGFHDRRKLQGEQDFAMLRTTVEFKQLVAQQRLD
jgi:tetratricopeptide (TPR) repeat protein